MTRSLHTPPTTLPAAFRADLTALLETAAYYAAQWYGARALLIERTGASAVGTTILVIAADGASTDLWQLDPLLWDDVQWAAGLLVDAGEFAVIPPCLHHAAAGRR